MNNTCPKCGASLQPQARFCPHCMTMFGEKTTLPTPHPAKKAVLPFVIGLLVVVLLIGVAVLLLPHLEKPEANKPAPAAVATTTVADASSPLCSIEQFREAAPRVSEKMGIDTFWDLDSLIDTHYSSKTKFRQYAIDTYVGDALLSLFFYNEGEEIGAYFCDVTPENLNKAESLLKCVVQGACNHYFTDIDKVFDDEKRYPKKDLPDPFITLYTDMLGRTDAYTAAMSTDTAISSRYITMLTEQEKITFVVTSRNTNGEVLYDLSVGITRAEP